MKKLTREGENQMILTPKPYTDEEILALLEDGRLAKTNFDAAILLAARHSKVKLTYPDYYEGLYEAVGLSLPGELRAEIPLPPKRKRCLTCRGTGSIRIEQEFPRDETCEVCVGDGGWGEEEPQKPLVITTEGGE